MSDLAAPKQRAALSDYLAAERTFLAWLRTGVALMGFGFVVARFGLLLQELRLSAHAVAAPAPGVSRWFGATLIAVGLGAIAHAVESYSRLVRELDQGEPARPLRPERALLIAALLVLLGVTLAINVLVVQASVQVAPVKNEEKAMTTPGDSGLLSTLSHHSVDDTVARLETILKEKGVTLFAVVDHGGEAAKVGMKMPPTKLVIFGNPKAGTPLMLAAPASAIDLPLKILVAEDAEGKVWVSYNSPAYLQQRHHLPPELLANIAVVETLAAKAAE